MEIELHRRGVKADDTLADFVQKQIEVAIGRFEERIDAVTVRLRDDNGPRGGVDKQCQMTVRLRPSGEVLVEERAADMFAAVKAAADRMGQAVRREIGRRKRGIGGQRPRRSRV